jgi:hypothetical protein
MKIEGKDWMDWLHQVRQESQKQRKSSRRSLATHLRTVEGKTTSRENGKGGQATFPLIDRRPVY